MSPPHISEGLNREASLQQAWRGTRGGPKLQPSIIAQGRPLLDLGSLLNPLKTRLQTVCPEEFRANLCACQVAGLYPKGTRMGSRIGLHDAQT